MSGLVIDHELVEKKLAAADLDQSGAEVHGVLCGLLCTGRDDALELWFDELFHEAPQGDLLIQECRQTLHRLYAETQQAIEGPGLGFTPLLPDERKPIQLRASAVSHWCQGFLYGVGLSGVAPKRQLSEHTREALQDFSDITRMDLAALKEDDEEEEEALMQLTEFLWVAAMLVYDDLVADTTARS
jgi:uncharacterized protein YgfB (UPF0149 family)